MGLVTSTWPWYRWTEAGQVDLPIDQPEKTKSDSLWGLGMTTSGATPTVSWLRTQSSLEFGATISYDPFNLKLLAGDLMFFQVEVLMII